MIDVSLVDRSNLVFGQSLGSEVFGTVMPSKNNLFGGASRKGARHRISDHHRVCRSNFDALFMKGFGLFGGNRRPFIESGLWVIGVRTVTTSRRLTRKDQATGDKIKLDQPLPGVDSTACVEFIRDSLERVGFVDNDARLVVTHSISIIGKSKRVEWVLAPIELVYSTVSWMACGLKWSLILSGVKKDAIACADKK